MKDLDEDLGSGQFGRQDPKVPMLCLIERVSTVISSARIVLPMSSSLVMQVSHSTKPWKISRLDEVK